MPSTLTIVEQLRTAHANQPGMIYTQHGAPICATVDLVETIDRLQQQASIAQARMREAEEEIRAQWKRARELEQAANTALRAATRPKRGDTPAWKTALLAMPLNLPITARQLVTISGISKATLLPYLYEAKRYSLVTQDGSAFARIVADDVIIAAKRFADLKPSILSRPVHP